jgi:hypothetical protein
LWLHYHVFVTKQVRSLEDLTKRRTENQASNFCIYLHNNNVPVRRKSVLNLLNQYKYVHTKGDVSIPDGSIHKLNHIKNFKFSFAMQNHFYKENFENVDVPGLIDEKVIESLIAGTIPLYYGNNQIGEILNEDAILNYHKFNSDEAFVEEIIKIDKDKNLYREIASQPIIKNLSSLGLEDLEAHLLKIISL